MMKFLLAFFLLMYAACSDTDSSASSAAGKEKDLEGFVHLKAPKNPVILGTNMENAKTMDAPQMNVVLDYDFYISSDEISCDEFSKYQDMPVDHMCDASGAVTYITYYDAVLYANARSKAEKMDTVYSYSKVQRDNKGSCINLVGLKFNSEVEGFRIPTEAEWVYAFNEIENSVHVKEWVNDWLGRLKDTTITDFVGAVNGGSLDEHVLKGGDYSSDQFNVNSYNRGDIYTVSSSTRIYYVGFRLAYGKIPGAQWLTNQGTTVDGTVSLQATSQDVFRKLKSYRIKLAFRNNLNGNLAFVDFNNGRPRLVDITDSLEMFHPDISPDGQWVAFSTGSEGITGKSNVYARKLSENSFPVLLKVDNASIPRWRISPEGDTVLVYVTDSGNNADDGDFFSRSTWQVSFAKGVFGTPEKLFDGAYHGGISQDQRLAVTGARKLRARIAQGENGTVFESQALDTLWYNQEQACNASLSQDGTKRTLFLDFGSNNGKGAEFVGHKYGVHEQLLIADSTGRLIQMVSAPENYAFDHTEWVGKTGFVVATLTGTSGNHERIVLVDLSDSSFTELVAGTDLFHPCLWVDENLKNVELDETLSVDSAGLYVSDNFLQEDVFWRYKMELLWKLKDTADVVVVGSSRPFNGIRPKLMNTPTVVANLAQTPNSIFTSRDLVRNYILPHFKKLKYLVVSLDLDFWWKSDVDVYNFFKGTYKIFPGFVYRGFSSSSKSDLG
ncbi:TIGR02171 family protein [Fibrobacter sp. UWR1]|uniref:TIGR02171 family lipoprotein n=1 Tax=Fibrobacter sp. UWR1 TaxID=2135645 RepID=UPI000DACC762|nr:TIGR02171 family protein [Fibrobacter sp. UWR1]PZW74110.1 uncharacterized protein (TIGR02171 family) [Fibrobacter sp. UWR1]